MKTKISLFCILLGLCALFSACNSVDVPQDFGEWEVIIAPTCDHAGEAVRVSKSDPTITETSTIPATGHAWGDWEIETNATCLVAGVKYRVCAHSDTHVDNAAIEPLGHAFENWATLVDATCTTAGSEQSVCNHDASHITTRVVMALGHDYADFVTTKAPTCTAMGIETSVCRNNSNHIIMQNLPALGHDYNDWAVTKSPTCTENGTESKTCKNGCNYIETREVEAIGHNYGEWITVLEPTDSENGEQISVCVNNKNHVESRVLHALGSDGLFYYTEVEGEYTVGLENYYATTLYIPAYHNGLPVTKIGDNMFAFAPNLTTVVVMGNQLKTVGFGAFIGCENLERIVLPNSLERIEDYAFSFLYNLFSIIIPQNVAYIGADAFFYSGLDAPLFVHVRASEPNANWNNDWFEAGRSLVVYGSTYQYGDEQPNFFTLSYPSGEGGAVAGVSVQYVFEGGTGVPVVATAYLGYRFSHWSDGLLSIERTDGNISADFSVTAYFEIDLEGSGTQADPYIINDYSDMRKMHAFSYAHFKMVDDIDLLNVECRAIFSEQKPFNGVLDGNGKAIRNMVVTQTNYASLLGYIGKRGVVKNLSITDFSVGIPTASVNTSKLMPMGVGALACVSYGRLENVAVSGMVFGLSLTGDGYAIGGLVGQALGGKIVNCFADVQIIIDSFTYAGVRTFGYNIGGLVGAFACDIIDSSVKVQIRVDGLTDPTDNGTVVLGEYSGISVGGLAGIYYPSADYHADNITISGCNAEVDIYVNCRSTVAGFVAYISTYNTVFSVVNCNVSGKITGNQSTGFIYILNVFEGSRIEECNANVEVVGVYQSSGFVGMTQKNGSGFTLVDSDGNRVGNGILDIVNCYATGDVYGDSVASGFGVYLSCVYVDNCYFSGTITARDAYGFGGVVVESVLSNCYAVGILTATRNAGGFASSITMASVSGCYFSGEIYSNGSVGGFAYMVRNSAVSNCYAEGEITCQSSSVGYVSGFIATVLRYDNVIESCYSSCNITIFGNGNVSVGGIVGYLSMSYFGDNYSSVFTNCYYSGKIMGSVVPKYIGGLAGDLVGSGSALFDNCRWLAEDSLAQDAIGFGSAERYTLVDCSTI